MRVLRSGDGGGGVAADSTTAAGDGERQGGDRDCPCEGGEKGEGDQEWEEEWAHGDRGMFWSGWVADGMGRGGLAGCVGGWVVFSLGHFGAEKHGQ